MQFLPPATHTHATPSPLLQAQQSTARRDLLLKLQQDSQAKWAAAKVFETDAPAEGGEWIVCQ